MSNKNQQDWLKSTLSSSRKLLDELPQDKKTALDNDAKFHDAVRCSEQGISAKKLRD